jgi:DNA-binding CsgD family transcriptional regulator
VAHGGDLASAEQLIDEVNVLVGGDIFPSAVAAVTVAAVRGVLDPTTADLIDRVERSEAVETPLGRLDPYAIHSGVSRLLVVDGQLDRAEAWARRAVEQAPKDRRLAYMPESHLGAVLAWRGRTHEALQWARRAAELQRAAGLVTAERWSRITMLVSAVYIGDLDEARRTEAELDRLPVGPSTTRAGDEWYARSVLAELAGEMDLSLRWARDGVVESARRGARFDELMGWMSIAWLDVGYTDVERVRELGPMTGGMGASLADYAIGRATNSAELISQASEHLIAAGCNLIAVGFAAHAADAWTARGDDRAAARWARRATEIAAGLELVSVFAPVTIAEPLSRREREVADLAVLGLSSREIGDRLFLSTRTVDNHLARAYGKLGVGGRAELADALTRA